MPIHLQQYVYLHFSFGYCCCCRGTAVTDVQLSRQRPLSQQRKKRGKVCIYKAQVRTYRTAGMSVDLLIKARNTNVPGMLREKLTCLSTCLPASSSQRATSVLSPSQHHRRRANRTPRPLGGKMYCWSDLGSDLGSQEFKIIYDMNQEDS